MVIKCLLKKQINKQAIRLTAKKGNRSRLLLQLTISHKWARVCAPNQIIESEAMHCSEKVHCFVKCILQNIQQEHHNFMDVTGIFPLPRYIPKILRLDEVGKLLGSSWQSTT